MSIHRIEPERRTLHGTFSREYPPVLTIEPGDSVEFRTLDAGWGLEAPRPGADRMHFEPRDRERDSGHALCGPVAVRGAAPGMILAVRIDVIEVGAYGFTCCGGWEHPVNRRFGLVEQEWFLTWSIDRASGTATDHFGRTVSIRPFMGVMGLSPDAPGFHSTAPPRPTGGNLDCRELIAGSTLYLPIAVPGALFSVGDGHAVQGDGEVCVTAIECPMERVTLTFHLLEGPRLTMPRAETPAGWLTMGLHEDLNEATFLALEGMVDLMRERYGFTTADALALASLVVDLRVTQIANGVLGVHALLPHGAIGAATVTPVVR